MKGTYGIDLLDHKLQSADRECHYDKLHFLKQMSIWIQRSSRINGMQECLLQSSVSVSRQKTLPCMSLLVIPTGRTKLDLLVLAGVLSRSGSRFSVASNTASSSLTAREERLPFALIVAEKTVSGCYLKNYQLVTYNSKLSLPNHA